MVNPISCYTTLGLRCTNLVFSLYRHLFICVPYMFDFVGYGVILGMYYSMRNDAMIYCA